MDFLQRSALEQDMKGQSRVLTAAPVLPLPYGNTGRQVKSQTPRDDQIFSQHQDRTRDEQTASNLLWRFVAGRCCEVNMKRLIPFGSK